MTVGPLVMAVGRGLAVPRRRRHVVLDWACCRRLVVFGLGLALMVAPLTATVLAAAPEDRAGIASGVNNAVARAGSLLAVAALPVAVGLSGDAVRRPGRLRRRLREGDADLRGAARGRRRASRG